MARISLSATAGIVAWQEFTFDDANGDELASHNTDPAPFLGLSATVKF